MIRDITCRRNNMKAMDKAERSLVERNVCLDVISGECNIA